MHGSLKEIRKSHTMSQWYLARLSRVHQSRISLYENELTDLTQDEQDRIAKALGVDPKKVFGDGKSAVQGNT
ncbi:MAG: helix-turn-helix domain-containing protein [bacterium]